MGKFLKYAVVIAVVAGVIVNLDDIRRYIKMSRCKPFLNFVSWNIGLLLEAVGQVIQDRVTILRFHLRAPPGHLVDLAIPLCAGKALLPHHVLIVATEASGLNPSG